MIDDIRYIEEKTDGLRGKGRIARVGYSKTGKTIYWNGLTLVPCKGSPLKSNYYARETKQDYWVSSPARSGSDTLFPMEVFIDDDVREDYWSIIRGKPEQASLSSYRSPGKTKKEKERLEKGLRRRQMDNGWMPQ
mgnify:CR=1 FL=1